MDFYPWNVIICNEYYIMTYFQEEKYSLTFSVLYSKEVLTVILPISTSYHRGDFFLCIFFFYEIFGITECKDTLNSYS